MKWITKIIAWVRQARATQEKPVVTFDESRVECLFPNGTTQIMLLSELRAIAVETNDKGPFVEDVYFMLFSNSKDQFCSIPQCAEGSQQLIARLAQFPEFNNEALIAAMGCTSNRLFLCWENPPWIGENWPAVVAERNRWKK